MTTKACTIAYETLSSFQGQDKTVQFIASDEDELFSIHESQGVVDIGIGKKQYLKIFKEAHDFWHQHQQDFIQVNQSYSYERLFELYKVTIGYLLTTNDHHMMMKLHEIILAQLYKRDPTILIIEFEILTTLVSSKLSKINKNSLLWHLIKKITIMLGLNETEQLETEELQSIAGHRNSDHVTSSSLYQILVDRVLNSCVHHFANYYGNFFIRWLVQINKVLGHDNQYVLSNLLTQCHRQLKDVSLWSSLHILLYENDCKNMIDDYNFTVEDIRNKFCMDIASIEPTRNHMTSSNDVFPLVQSEIEWLLSIECSIKTPYLMLINPSEKHRLFAMITTRLDEEKRQLNRLDPEGLLYSNKLAFIHTLQQIVRSS